MLVLLAKAVEAGPNFIAVRVKLIVAHVKAIVACFEVIAA